MLPKHALYQTELRPVIQMYEIPRGDPVMIIEPLKKNLRLLGGVPLLSGGVDGTRTRNTQIDNLVL